MKIHEQLMYIMKCQGIPDEIADLNIIEIIKHVHAFNLNWVLLCDDQSLTNIN